MEEKRRGYGERDVDACRRSFCSWGRPCCSATPNPCQLIFMPCAIRAAMLERIESNAARAIGGVVAQAVGNEAVPSFVQCDGDQDRDRSDALVLFQRQWLIAGLVMATQQRLQSKVRTAGKPLRRAVTLARRIGRSQQGQGVGLSSFTAQL
jgi:hypothetical protein